MLSLPGVSFEPAALDKAFDLVTSQSPPIRKAIAYALGRFKHVVTSQPPQLSSYQTRFPDLYLVERSAAPGIDVVVLFTITASPVGVDVHIVLIDVVMGSTQRDAAIANANALI